MCSAEKVFFNSEIGMLEIGLCKVGVHTVRILSGANENFKDKDTGVLNLDKAAGSVRDTVLAWMKSYFASTVKLEYIPPVCPSVFLRKGNFSAKVWKTLMTEVKFGQTVSYGQLAALCGNEKASRAVGSAMKNNPIPLIIPCHRVIKSDGSIGHFSSGIVIKEWLLEHENVFIKSG